VTQCNPQKGETVLVVGQGPIGLLFTMLLRRTGAKIYATDTIERRLELSRRSGAIAAWNPRKKDVVSQISDLTEGRGADLVIVAASAPGLVEHAIACSRPEAVDTASPRSGSCCRSHSASASVYPPSPGRSTIVVAPASGASELSSPAWRSGVTGTVSEPSSCRMMSI